MGKKIKVCVDHINEIFSTEDLATQVDFGTLCVSTETCELITRAEHVTEPLTMDHIDGLYII